MLVTINKIYKKIFKLYNQIKSNDIYCMILDDYYYDFKKKSYILVFRIKNTSIGQKISVNDAFFNKNLLAKLHPIDAYKVGVISGMERNNIFYKKPYHNSNLKSYYHKNDIKIKPIFQLKDISLTAQYNNITLNLIDTNYELSVNLDEFQNKQFLLHGLHPLHAATIGFIISEYFITKFNFNL